MLLSNPDFWNVAIALSALAIGWAARHFGGAPAVPVKPVPAPGPVPSPGPVPAPAPTPMIPDGLTDILLLLKSLFERKQQAEAMVALEELKAHAPSTVLPKNSPV